MKWRHTDGCSLATAAQFHALLESIERNIGELGAGTWSVSYVSGRLRVETVKGVFEVDFPDRFGGRVKDWLIDAVIARKSLRRMKSDPTFGATRD